MVQSYIIDIGVNLQTKAVVPIGYDYGCDHG